MLFIQRICRFLPPHCPRSVQHLSIFSGTITLEMWKQKANRIIWKIKRNKKGDDGLLYWYHGRELVNVMCDRDLPCFFFLSCYCYHGAEGNKLCRSRSLRCSSTKYAVSFFVLIYTLYSSISFRFSNMPFMYKILGRPIHLIPSRISCDRWPH